MDQQEVLTEIKALKAELIGKIEKGASAETVQALQRQVDALDVKLAEKHYVGTGEKGLEKLLEENESVSRLLADKKGTAVIVFKGNDSRLLERKATLTAIGQGFQTTGVMQIDRIPGITEEARMGLTVRDLLVARPTTLGVIDFIRVLNPMTRASPVGEASDKFEQAVTFTAHSEKVQTIAHWQPASRQILDDMSELGNFLDGSLRYYLGLSEEVQLLTGDGTGINLNGLITLADAFSTALLSASAGWTRIDVVGRAIQQITVSKEIPPTFVIMHPTDWWSMRLQKDSFGRYLLGDPQTVVSPSLFGLTVVPTTSITSGTFLVGSGNQAACEIRDRMETIVEISTSHDKFFVQNLVAVRCEKRLALVTKRVHSFVTGTFSQSPA
jgi:HK97 family phage major capsid protein